MSYFACAEPLNMRRTLILLSILLAAHAGAQAPTWADDVACIVYSHCTGCHHPGGIAGGVLDLTSYDEAHGHRDDIQAYTTARVMPPWPPDPAYRSLAHERRLTQDEIDIIAAWAAADGPQGNLANAPSVPVYATAQEITAPDVSVIMPTYQVPTIGSDLYRCFVMPSGSAQDNFIKRLEVVPGNRSIVHHVLVYQDTSGQAQVLDNADPSPGYSSFGGIGVSGAPLLGVWVPGSSVMSTPDGMGIKLLAGADIVIQVHYPEDSDLQTDSTRVNVEFTEPGFTRDLGILSALYHFPPSLQEDVLAISPGEVSTFHEQFQVPIPATLTAIGPHAHLLCKDMRAWAITPDDDSIPLIHIPDWDFHWQGMYEFQHPIYLPSGSVLYGEATYDNTSDNEDNPNDPPAWVTLGEATTDEMMLFYFAYTYGFPFDTLTVVDDSEHAAHHENCTTDFNIGLDDEMVTDVFSVNPVPATDRLAVTVPSAGYMLDVMDVQGRAVMRRRLSSGLNEVDVAALARGTVIAAVRDAQGRVLQRSPLLLQ